MPTPTLCLLLRPDLLYYSHGQGGFVTGPTGRTTDRPVTLQAGRSHYRPASRTTGRRVALQAGGAGHSLQTSGQYVTLQFRIKTFLSMPHEIDNRVSRPL